MGLWGQVRRRWGLREVKITQKVQIVFAWRYLVLGVNVVTGALKWAWIERVSQTQLIPVVQRWAPDAVVWDSAPSHKAKKGAELDCARVFLPAYAPELNPPERIFEELRREVEGVVYPSLQAKVDAVDRILRQLAADKARVKRLIGWGWICDAFAALPASPDSRSQPP
ncbi:MAG: hypothetical protein Kow00120_08430 [Anaerolineae bacterium]